jgi:hypothetical protein
MHPVATPRQQFEAGSRARLVFGFGQDAPAAGDDRVRGEDKRAGIPRDYCLRLFPREANRMRGRQLTAVGSLINVGRIDAVGHEAHLAQQFEAAR